MTAFTPLGPKVVWCYSHSSVLNKIQLIHFLGTWKLYILAGRKIWEAILPIYNGIVLLKIIGRPTWWVILLFMPVINLIMFPVIWVETIRSFGKKSNLSVLIYDTILTYIRHSKMCELLRACSSFLILFFVSVPISHFGV